MATEEYCRPTLRSPKRIPDGPEISYYLLFAVHSYSQLSKNIPMHSSSIVNPSKMKNSLFLLFSWAQLLVTVNGSSILQHKRQSPAGSVTTSSISNLLTPSKLGTVNDRYLHFVCSAALYFSGQTETKLPAVMAYLHISAGSGGPRVSLLLRSKHGIAKNDLGVYVPSESLQFISTHLSYRASGFSIQERHLSSGER
jgi:hypothetical protein